ncbi:MAG: hypothetical protein RI897_2519 [Verrucomicrobiota bacterium]
MAEDSLADVFEHFIDEPGAFDAVGCFGEHEAFEEDFGGGGSDFSGEHGVAGIDGRLGFLGEVALHGVAHFMGEGRYAVEVPLVVEEHVRGGEVGAHVVGSASFAGIFEDIDPAGLEGELQDGGIFRSEGLRAFEHEVSGLFEGVVLFWCFSEVDVEVVEVDGVELESLFFQGYVAVEERGMFGDGLGEIVVDGDGEVFGVE